MLSCEYTPNFNVVYHINKILNYVMTWKRFQHNGTFVERINSSHQCFPHNRAVQNNCCYNKDFEQRVTSPVVLKCIWQWVKTASNWFVLSVMITIYQWRKGFRPFDHINPLLRSCYAISESTRAVVYNITNFAGNRLSNISWRVIPPR